jgi:hypothetical protein
MTRPVTLSLREKSCDFYHKFSGKVNRFLIQIKIEIHSLSGRGFFSYSEPKAMAAAAMVFWITSLPWAVDRKLASNGDGARYIP